MKKSKILLLCLFPIGIFINFIASKFPYAVEKYYSQGINKYTVQILSKVSGIFNFSLYEVFMYIIVISLLLFLVSAIFIALKNTPYLVEFLKKSIVNFLCILSIAYFLFVVLWGLNYNRVPLKNTLISNYNINQNKNLDSTDNTLNDLKSLYKNLIEKANNSRKLVSTDNNNTMKSDTGYIGIIERAKLGYTNISHIIPEVKGNYSKAKYVKSSNLMCYTGITGIYFPFTGEANVNIAIPDIYIPSTVSHEMAHQRGFASEDEANFIAYLASINHPDIDFNYSGYILALNHTASALRKSDYNSYIELTKNISEDVLSDLRNNSNFWKKYEGKIEKVSDSFNNSYLKANGVKEGTLSYGKMVDLLLTYYNLYKFD